MSLRPPTQGTPSTSSVETRMALRANLPVNVGDYGTDEADVLAAIAAAPAYGAVAFVPGVTYTLTDRLPVTANGVTLIGNGCKIRQGTVQKPCFDVSGDDVTIDGFDLAYTGTKAYSASSYRGGQLYTGQAGVVSGGNRLTVRNCRASNFVAGVFLDNWNGATLTGTRTDNVIDRLYVTGVDFGVLAGGQDGLMVNGVRGDTTLTAASPNPPHLVYITDAAANTNVHLSDCHARNITSWAYQIKGVAGGTVANLTASGCAGLLSILNCQDMTLDAISGILGTTTSGNGAIYIQDSATARLTFNGVLLTTSVADERLIRIDGTDNRFSGVTMEAAHATIVDNGDILFNTTATRCVLDGLRYSNRLGAGSGGGRAVEVQGASCVVRDVGAINVKFGVVMTAAATSTVIDVNEAAITLASGGSAKVSDSGTGTKRATISGTATWDPPSIADAAMTATTVTVSGAKLGDSVAVGFTTALPAGAMLVGGMGADGTARVVLFNKTGGALDLASGTVRVDVFPR